MLIRNGTHDDLDQLVKLEREAFTVHAWSPKKIQSCLESKNAVWVATKETLIVGFIIHDPTDQGTEIINLVVSPEHRRKGVAKALLQHIITYMGAKLCFSLHVAMDNQGAYKLYRKFGFRTLGIDKGYYHGDDAYIMERKPRK